MLSNQKLPDGQIASDEELELKWQTLEQGGRVFFRPGEFFRIMTLRKARKSKSSQSTNTQPPRD